jgi:hypothetical protein
LLLALAAQQAGPGFQNIEQLMLKRVMAGRDPVRFTGGTINEQGDVLNDPGFMEDKRRQELMRQRGGLENKQNAIVLGRERDAAQADQRDRDRRLQAQIAAGQQGIASVMASIAQTNAETRADAARAKTTADGKQAEQDAMMGTYLDAAENLLKQDPTGSGLGTAANVALSAAGVSTRKTQLDNQLKNVAGYLTSAVPRMQGPQSNYDVQLYQQMAGDVGNTSKPVADRLAAVQFMKAIHAGQAFMPGPDGRPVLKTGSAPAAPAGGGGWSITREP